MSDITVLVFVQAWIDGLGSWIIFCLWRKLQLARDLILAETIRKEMHTSIFKQQSDPEKILSEMEASAVASEALRADRTMKIRDDAGPPAIIHKPPTRSTLPAFGVRSRSPFERQDGIWPDTQLDTSDSED